jgi:hypothetical protein
MAYLKALTAPENIQHSKYQHFITTNTVITPFSLQSCPYRIKMCKKPQEENEKRARTGPYKN